MQDSPVGGDLAVRAELIKQGAEARIYKGVFLGKTTIIKERFVKNYRHPQLDSKINENRLSQEARSLLKARRSGVLCPAVYFVDIPGKRLYIEYLEGRTVKDFIQNGSVDEGELAQKIGSAISAIHAVDLVHGDLTTSNMIVTPSGELGLIDFGLSYTSRNADEDKAVDLYVLERAFLSTHPNSEQLFAAILNVYSKSNKTKSVIAKLEQVRMRGRKKLAFG